MAIVYQPFKLYGTLKYRYPNREVEVVDFDRVLSGLVTAINSQLTGTEIYLDITTTEFDTVTNMLHLELTDGTSVDVPISALLDADADSKAGFFVDDTFDVSANGVTNQLRVTDGVTTTTQVSGATSNTETFSFTGEISTVANATYTSIVNRLLATFNSNITRQTDHNSKFSQLISVSNVVTNELSARDLSNTTSLVQTKTVNTLASTDGSTNSTIVQSKASIVAKTSPLGVDNNVVTVADGSGVTVHSRLDDILIEAIVGDINIESPSTVVLNSDDGAGNISAVTINPLAANFAQTNTAGDSESISMATDQLRIACDSGGTDLSTIILTSTDIITTTGDGTDEVIITQSPTSLDITHTDATTTGNIVVSATEIKSIIDNGTSESQVQVTPTMSRLASRDMGGVNDNASLIVNQDYIKLNTRPATVLNNVLELEDTVGITISSATDDIIVATAAGNITINPTGNLNLGLSGTDELQLNASAGLDGQSVVSRGTGSAPIWGNRMTTGNSALVNGTVTVANTAVTAGSTILLEVGQDGTSVAIGVLKITAKTNGVDFTVQAHVAGTANTLANTDQSPFRYVIIN